MSRGLSSGMVSAVGAKEVRPALACFMDLVSGPIRVWTGIGNKTWDGNTYNGIGMIGGVSPIQESTAVVANGISLNLTGIPSDMISVALQERYRGRKVYLWLWLFDGSNALITSPVQLFAGRLNTMTIQDSGETATITIAAESRIVDLNRARERRFTDGDQKQLYPGDLGFEFVANLQNADWPWGRVINAGATAPTYNNPTYYNPAEW